MPVAEGFVVQSGVRLPLVLFLMCGRMRVLMHLPGLREVRLADLSTGATFGLAPALLDEPAWASAVVLESCVVRTIAVCRLRELIDSDAVVARWIAKALAREARRLHFATARFGAGAEARLQIHLAELLVGGATELPDKTLRLSTVPSQEQIAQAIGVTRQHVSHLLAAAESDGVIRRQKGRYMIPATSPVVALRDPLHRAGTAIRPRTTIGQSSHDLGVNDLRLGRRRSD